MVERVNRSNKYQAIYVELSYSNEMMAEFTEREGIIQKADPELKERVFELKEQLKLAFWRLVDQELTKRQKEVLKLCAQGLTQIEIAKKLNVNQSSITKSINGNCDYRNGKRIYGGVKRKMRRLADEDKEIQEILKELGEISAELDGF